MELFIIFAGILVLSMVLVLCSTPLLRINLGSLKDDLESILLSGLDSEREEIQSFIDRIDGALANLNESYPKRKKRDARKLSREIRRYLIQKVPCFSEQGEIPSFESRHAENSKCKICNETNCIFHF